MCNDNHYANAVADTKPEKIDYTPWLFCAIGEHLTCAGTAELQRGITNICPCDCHKNDKGDDDE
jgi:hypothetical protein